MPTCKARLLREILSEFFEPHLRAVLQTWAGEHHLTLFLEASSSLLKLESITPLATKSNAC
jgi:hypothetical protein